MARGRTGILFIHSSNEMYGADKILLQVLKTLPPEEKLAATVWLPNDVSPATFPLDEELTSNGFRFEIRSLPILRRKYMSPRFLPRSVMAALLTGLALRRLAPKIVYLTTSASLPAGILARLLGVKQVILHCQEVWRGREAHVLGALAMAATDCLCISDSTRLALKGPVRSRSRVMLNGVPDCETPRSTPAGRGGVTFLIASRWNAWKGHATLLSAWDADASPGQLVIVGGPPDMGQAVDVPGMVAGMSNRDSVKIHGEVREISVLIDDSDFVVVPSDEPEPFGLIAIEAFARGRAVIASNGGGLAEIVDEGITGRLFPLRDAHALRAIMEDLDMSQAIAMGQSARATYLREYSIEAFDKRFKALWDEILPSTGDN